ncbi:MAG: RidA family protein [Candidatus Binatia bacterium]
MATPRTQPTNPPGVAKPVKPYYSNCVQVTAGPLLFISGQVAIDAAGKTVGGNDMVAQGRQVFANLRAILQANGADLADVIKLTVFVTDMRAFGELTALRSELWPSSGPASTLVEVSKLANPEWLIEVEAVAAVP